jgi:hypothetical protein
MRSRFIHKGIGGNILCISRPFSNTYIWRACRDTLWFKAQDNLHHRMRALGYPIELSTEYRDSVFYCVPW